MPKKIAKPKAVIKKPLTPGRQAGEPRAVKEQSRSPKRSRGTGTQLSKKEKYEDMRLRLCEMRKLLLNSSQEEYAAGLGSEDKFAGVSDDSDLASLLSSDYLAATNTSRKAALLKEVNEAIRRVEEGVYGTCEDCGEEINMKRLTAIPWTIFCVDCKETHERMVKNGNAVL